MTQKIGFPLGTLNRCLSYNDLKKKRMNRANITKGKLKAINLQKINIHDENVPSANRMCQINLYKKALTTQHQIKKSYAICSGKNIAAQMKQQINNLQNKNLQIAQERKASVEILGLKKNKSVRILTKKNINTCPIKLCQNEIKMKLTCKQNSKFQSSKYSSLRQQTLHERKFIRQTFGQQDKDRISSLLLSQLSPISKRPRLENTKEAQISGFSLIVGIETQIEQNSLQKKKIGLIKQDTGILSMPIIQLKHPKLMKRHLPKDFFLRV